MTDILDPPQQGENPSTAVEVEIKLDDPRRTFRPAGLEPGYAVSILTDQDCESWDEAERFVYREYRKIGFCQDSPREWVEEISQFRSCSELVTIRQDDRIVGVIRTMQSEFDNLPIGQFGRHTEVPEGDLLEFGSLTVEPGHRGLGIVNELHRQAVQATMIKGLSAFCMLVEPWSIDFYSDTYGLPLVQTAPARDYMGSITIPAYVRIDAMLENFIRNWPLLFEWITEGLPPETWARGDIPILLK